MHNQKTAILAIFTNEIGRQITLSLSSTLPQIQTAAEWLVEQSHPKTDLKLPASGIARSHYSPGNWRVSGDRPAASTAIAGPPTTVPTAFVVFTLTT